MGAVVGCPLRCFVVSVKLELRGKKRSIVSEYSQVVVVGDVLLTMVLEYFRTLDDFCGPSLILFLHKN